ncbi:hypothetical protein PC116_g18384 [Phytophthora cactorum]|nr:hypothetical protein PC116_g18384 [Phytophthora cactorum]
MDPEVARSLQHVVTAIDRAKYVEWIASTASLEGEKGLPGHICCRISILVPV